MTETAAKQDAKPTDAIERLEASVGELMNYGRELLAERDKLQAAFDRLTDWMTTKGWFHCTTELELMEQVDWIAAERDLLLAANAALATALQEISHLQRDKCENASAEILFMLLDNKVDIALSALKAHGPAKEPTP